MNQLSRLACISIFSFAAAMPAAAVAGEDVPRYVPLAAACPDALKDLPDNLYQAWRALDSAAEVVVDFRLDGHTISNITIAGVHSGYIGPVRSAVRSMKCGSIGEQGQAVRFRITFTYPEDDQAAKTVLQFSDEAPPLASL